MYRIILLWGILLMGIALLACASKGVPIEKPETRQALMHELQALAKEAWEAEWDRTLVEAKKEGKVIIASNAFTAGPIVRDALSLFEKKYGIKLNWIVAPAGDLEAKIFAERKAGIYGVDIIQEGGFPYFVMIKPQKLLEPILPNLILPEVKDEKKYWQGKYPLMDKEGMGWAQAKYGQVPFNINIDLVKKEEIVFYNDLLSPKWKGKIIMGDPTIAGAAQKWFAVLVHEPFGPILGIDYMKELVKQEPIVIRDNRLAMEWLLRGKYSVGLQMMGKSIRREWATQGIRVPVVDHRPKDGDYLLVGGTIISIMNKAPHPNATKIFLNWLFSGEGQILFSRAQGQQSTRMDIPPPEELAPEMSVRVPGVEYIFADDEDFILESIKYEPLARKIFGPLLRQ